MCTVQLWLRAKGIDFHAPTNQVAQDDSTSSVLDAETKSAHTAELTAQICLYDYSQNTRQTVVIKFNQFKLSVKLLKLFPSESD